MFFVYVIKSLSKNYIYAGLTNNFERRFKEYQSEKNKTTKAYGPYKILLVEKYETIQQARNRENYLKSGIGKEFLKLLSRTTIILTI